MVRTRTQLSRLQYALVYRTELQTYCYVKKGNDVVDVGHKQAVSV